MPECKLDGGVYDTELIKQKALEVGFKEKQVSQIMKMFNKYSFDINVPE